MKVTQLLDGVYDPELTDFDFVVRESANYKLGFWAYKADENYYLASDVLRGDNASVGSSEITVTFIDTVTRAEFDLVYPFTILNPATYYQYVALGVISEDEEDLVDNQ